MKILATALLAIAFASQGRQPDFRVQIWGDAVADFSIRMRAYSRLRLELERDLPVLLVTADAAELLKREHTLGERFRAARSGAKQGDIFTPAVSAAFKEQLLAHTNPDTCAALLDDNPGAIDTRVNGRYPEHRPMSSMAPAVLAALPPLPEDVEYRFAGRDLILLDTRARMVVDRMPLAIQCSIRVP